MNLTTHDLDRLCRTAIEAVLTTGKYISETRPVNVERKGTGGSLATDVVTEVDHESQRRILEILKPTLSEYDLALLTEESPDDGSRLEKDYFWCIDPIDGTLCFIEGIPGYAISIALISREGVPVIGVVYDPVGQTLYHAIRGGGVFLDNAPWKPDLSITDAPLTIFTDRSEAQGAAFAAIAKDMQATWGTYGGAVMNAIWCLENPPACYFKIPKKENGGGCFWDFAAITCIFQELGAHATDYSGHPLELNRKDSVHLNHCGVLFSTHAKIYDRFFKSTRKEL